MKYNFIKLFVFAHILLCSFSVLSAEKQEVKCHVSLLGGEQTIYFGLLKKQSMLIVAQNLKGKKIMTTLSAKKKSVYEVFECVLQEAKFSSTDAQYIESKIEL